jgi:AraC-like DNA-binding protein
MIVSVRPLERVHCTLDAPPLLYGPDLIDMSSHVLVSGPTTGVDRLIDQIRSHSLRWAEQLAEAGARGDLEGAISRLFNDVRFFKELIAQANQHVPGTPLDFAKQIHQFMLTNLHRGPTLKTLAKFLGYSEKYCSELFQVHMGQPFSQYLKHLRLDEARRLLGTGDLTLADIAQRLGFSDQFAFSHFFKRALGYSPKYYREAVLANVSGLSQEIDKVLVSCR